MQEMWVQSLSQEYPLEQEMATHSIVLAWKIPWIGEPGELQSNGSWRVRHDWATEHTTHTIRGVTGELVFISTDGSTFPSLIHLDLHWTKAQCWWPSWVSWVLDSNLSEHPGPVAIFSPKAQGSWHWDASLATWGEAHVWDAFLSLFAQAKGPKNHTKPHRHDSSKKDYKSLKL